MSEQLDNKLSNDYWRNRWTDNEIGWHRDVVNVRLEKFADQLLIKPEGSHKVFVPLCGKSLDMKWFYDKGCRVIAVDCAGEALEQFMNEHKIPFSRRKVGDAEVLESEDGRMVLWQCDLFEFHNLSGEKDFDAVWDRGSFVAINFDERERYIDLIHSIISADSRYLLEWYSYDGTKYGGPPKTSTEEEIERRFSKYFNVKTLLKEETYMSEFMSLKEGMAASVGVGDNESTMYISLFSPSK